jgi:hypothetical protein
LAAFSPHLNLTTINVRGLPAIVRSDGSAAVLLGHPLWQHDPLGMHLNGDQADSLAELKVAYPNAKVEVSDLYVLDRYPVRIFKQLAD